MNSRQRILASVACQAVDRVPFDFFDEAGDLFVAGRYQPAARLGLSYADQVRARSSFHRKFQTDLIFDTPVLVPSRVPHRVTMTCEGRPVTSPEPVLSSVSGMAWHAMPPPVVGKGPLSASSRGTVVKNVEWANGRRSIEALDLATGTTDVLQPMFSLPAELLANLDCLAGELSCADYAFARQLRSEVGPDVMLSATLLDPFSAIGWYLGNERLMYLLYADPRSLHRICEGLLEIALVLSSLYFISRKKMFPVIGVLAGIAGAAIAITGLLG